MLIAQVTDTHIKAAGKLAYRKVDAAAKLAACVAHLNALATRPDAVVMTGDIEGHVFAGSAAARGVIVSLHDARGREIARTRSEFDGFYNFIGVPGGDYEVRVSTKSGQTELVQPLSLDPQDGYIVLERIYIFE